ncbi:MAG: hypothetical protein NTY48_06800 [Candidatus Diapherotrites archaeon]|nr:hypothetical protein [Candidatus Diapherotrites archaeon]
MKQNFFQRRGKGFGSLRTLPVYGTQATGLVEFIFKAKLELNKDALLGIKKESKAARRLSWLHNPVSEQRQIMEGVLTALESILKGKVTGVEHARKLLMEYFKAHPLYITREKSVYTRCGPQLPIGHKAIEPSFRWLIDNGIISLSKRLSTAKPKIPKSSIRGGLKLPSAVLKKEISQNSAILLGNLKVPVTRKSRTHPARKGDLKVARQILGLIRENPFLSNNEIKRVVAKWANIRGIVSETPVFKPGETSPYFFQKRIMSEGRVGDILFAMRDQHIIDFIEQRHAK